MYVSISLTVFCGINVSLYDVFAVSLTVQQVQMLFKNEIEKKRKIKQVNEPAKELQQIPKDYNKSATVIVYHFVQFALNSTTTYLLHTTNETKRKKQKKSNAHFI